MPIPTHKRYFLSGLFQCKEKFHPRRRFSKTEVWTNEILLGIFQIPLYSDLEKRVFIHFLKQYLGSGPTSLTACIKFLLSTGRTLGSPCKTWTNLAPCSLLQRCCDVDLESLKIWTFLLLMADSHRSTGYPRISRFYFDPRSLFKSSRWGTALSAYQSG